MSLGKAKLVPIPARLLEWQFRCADQRLERLHVRPRAGVWLSESFGYEHTDDGRDTLYQVLRLGVSKTLGIVSF